MSALRVLLIKNLVQLEHNNLKMLCAPPGGAAPQLYNA